MHGAIGLAEFEQLRPPRDEPLECAASRSTPSTASRYPMGVVSMRAGAISRRSRMMQPGITFDHEAGRSSPQSAVARDSTATDLSEARDERAEHEPVTRGEHDPPLVERQRPQNAQVHDHTVGPNPIWVKIPDNGLIPAPSPPISPRYRRVVQWSGSEQLLPSHERPRTCPGNVNSPLPVARRGCSASRPPFWSAPASPHAPRRDRPPRLRPHPRRTP